MVDINVDDYIGRRAIVAIVTDENTVIYRDTQYDRWQTIITLAVTAEIITLVIDEDLWFLPRGVYQIVLRTDGTYQDTVVYQLIQGPTIIGEFPTGDDCEKLLADIAGTIVGTASGILAGGLIGGPSIIIGIVIAATGFGVAIGIALIIFGILAAAAAGGTFGSVVGISLADRIAAELRPFICVET